MPAENNDFPWLSYYGHYNFFEKRMGDHGRVLEVNKIEPGLYEIVRDLGTQEPEEPEEPEERLKVFVCECYSYGVVEYMETLEKLGQLNVIVINSSWCGYTPDLKKQCREENVGLFNIAQFMAALNKPDYWNYLDADQKERFKKTGWI